MTVGMAKPERKTYRARMEFKEDGEPGTFSAVFSTLNVIDHDRDVTLPGAFEENAPAPIAAWNHDWNELPVGRGEIHETESVGHPKVTEARMDGRFFLDTLAGKEHYLTVKALGELQEWSYSFDILEHEYGKMDDQDVRFLKHLKVHEVSPVMLGAGIDTRTLDIKGAKPYPNEHACRLREPGDFQADSFRRMSREHDGKIYGVIMGRLKEETTLTEQAYRYPIAGWSASQAKSHCQDHDGRFEAAAEKRQRILREYLEEFGAQTDSPNGSGGDGGEIEGEAAKRHERTAGDGKSREKPAKQKWPSARESTAVRIAIDMIAYDLQASEEGA